LYKYYLALYDRGRSDNRPQSSKSSKAPSIKPKQTTTSIQRQKAAKRSPARSANSTNQTNSISSINSKNREIKNIQNQRESTMTNREQLEKIEKLEKKLQEFELQNNAVQVKCYYSLIVI